MKKIAMIILAIGVLVSCAKEEQIDCFKNGIQVPCNQNNVECLNQYGQEVNCPDGTFTDGTTSWYPISEIQRSGTLTRESVQNGTVNACITYRQVHQASDDYKEDFLMDAQSITVQVTDQAHITALSQPGLKDLIFDESNQLVMVILITGKPAGTPCTNWDAWLAEGQ